METIVTATALLVISIGAVFLLTGRALRGERHSDPHRPVGPWDWGQDSHFWHTQGIR
jgi:hypothetical protein